MKTCFDNGINMFDVSCLPARAVTSADNRRMPRPTTPASLSARWAVSSRSSTGYVTFLVKDEDCFLSETPVEVLTD
jgi:hypothetical protein